MSGLGGRHVRRTRSWNRLCGRVGKRVVSMRENPYVTHLSDLNRLERGFGSSGAHQAEQCQKSLLLLLLLAHRQVRRPKLSARPAMLWPEAWPAPAHTAHTAVDTTADQPALRHSQQLGLVRRPQVEIDVVGAETTHRIEPLWAGRAAQRLIPAEAACTPAHPALMEGVVHLLRGRGSV